ncbi:MAG: TraB/GumN family protein [DPANN group archaeon]|nr:TraB/GumN family protein [DPANN group archaeon]
MPVNIIGTSHIARESIQKVRRLVIDGKPDIVAVELDAARANALYDKHKRKVPLSAIKTLGFYGFLFQLIGGSLQQKLGKLVKTKPGADMKAAIDAAREVNAEIALIDQPIQDTLKNISRIRIWEKLKFVFWLLASMFSKQDLDFELDKVPAEDLVYKMISQLKKEFPGLYKAIVADRDEHIVNQIKHLAGHFPDKKILVVIGAGHLKGVKTLLAKNQ